MNHGRYAYPRRHNETPLITQPEFLLNLLRRQRHVNKQTSHRSILRNCQNIRKMSGPAIWIRNKRVHALRNGTRSRLKPLPPRRSRIRTLPNIILQHLDTLLAGNDKPQESLVRTCRRQSLFGDLNYADVFGGMAQIGFRGAEEEVGFLDVREGCDILDIYTRTEKEVKDAVFENGRTNPIRESLNVGLCVRGQITPLLEYHGLRPRGVALRRWLLEILRRVFRAQARVPLVACQCVGAFHPFFYFARLALVFSSRVLPSLSSAPVCQTASLRAWLKSFPIEWRPSCRNGLN